MIGSVFAGMAIAAAMGVLAVRTRGIYFAMVTLALSQCVYYVALEATDWTGGETGCAASCSGASVHSISSIPPPATMWSPQW